jgi:hypothetical protein
VFAVVVKADDVIGDLLQVDPAHLRIMACRRRLDGREVAGKRLASDLSRVGASNKAGAVHHMA